MPRRAIRPSPAALAAALAALAALPACPGARRGPPPERFLPGAVRVAVILPEAGKAARDLAALQRTVEHFPGAGDAAVVRGSVTSQLGFDPLDPEALERAGFDPARGAALALTERDPPLALLVLPVEDATRVEQLLARLARERMGAGARATEPRGEATLVTFRRLPADPPVLAYALRDRYVLVSGGPEGAALAGAAAALAPGDSLAADAAFQRARKVLGDGDAALAFVPGAAALAHGLPQLRDGAALGLAAGEGRLRLRAAVLLGDRAPALAAALQVKGAGGGLAARLEPGAPVVARLDADPAALAARLLPLVPARVREGLLARGLDLERDVLAVLGPGGVVSAALSPRFSLVGLGADTLRDDPPRALKLEAVVPVREGAAEAALRWARYADPAHPPRAGADGVVRVPTPSGEIAWRLAGDRLALACGRPGRIDALLARLDGKGGPGWTAPFAGAEDALSAGAGGLVLDVPALARSVRALPPASFGTGPTGFVVRSVVERFVAPAERLAAIWLAAEVRDEALVVRLEAAARPGAEGAP